MSFDNLGAFRRTPREVFALVFELVTAERSTRNLRAICLVCRPWYTLAISLPNLWSFLPITGRTRSKRLNLWIQRSRGRSVHIVAPAPDVDLLMDREPLARCQDVQDTLVQVAERWGRLEVDCLETGEENYRGLQWVGKLAGRTLRRLETIDVKVSKHDVIFPSNCSLPRLRSLALGRGTCGWTTVVLPIASSTLKSFSLENVRLSYAIRISDMLSALQSAPALERLRVDEVEWTHSATQDTSPSVALPNLISLSLTSVDKVFSLVQPLQMPRLVELVIGDIHDDLGPVFTEFAQKTSTIQRLTTGLWEEEYMVESESGFIALLDKQPGLRSLAVGQASINRILVQRLTRCANRDGAKEIWLCPHLVNLELPVSSTSGKEVRNMVELRSAAGIQLASLTLVGKVDASWDRGGLSLHVGRLKVEDVENNAEGED